MQTTRKKIEDIDMKGLIRLAAAASDERREIKNAEQLRNQIVQFDEEVARICEGLSLKDRIAVFKAAMAQVEQFNRDPVWKDLFR